MNGSATLAAFFPIPSHTCGRDQIGPVVSLSELRAPTGPRVQDVAHKVQLLLQSVM
jgi:hypothetical protein